VYYEVNTSVFIQCVQYLINWFYYIR